MDHLKMKVWWVVMVQFDPFCVYRSVDPGSNID